MKPKTYFMKYLTALLLAATCTVQAQDVPTTVEAVNTTPGEESGRRVEAPMDTPPGLACELPPRWVSEQVNHPFPRIPLVVGKDIVYTASSSVNAVERDTGKRVWYFTPPGEYTYQDVFNANGEVSLKLDGNVVYFGGYQKALFALDARTGKELWSYPLERSVFDSIETDAQRVYVATSKTLFAINKKDGTLAWHMDLPNTHEVEFREPRLVNGKLYVFSNKVLYALDARTGKEIWTYRPAANEQEANATSPLFVYGVAPVIHGQQIVIQEYGKGDDGLSKYLTGIDLKTGTPQWRYKPRYLYPVMSVTPDDKILLTSGSFWSQYNIAENKMDWYFKAYLGGIARPPAVIDKFALYGTEKYYLYALDRDTGQEVFRFGLPKDGQGARTIVVDKGEVFFLGGDGRVYSYELKCPQLTF